MAHGEVSCRTHTPLAENQKSESHCVYIVFADMTGTTIRMIRGTPNEPFLSPMPLVDRHLTENEYVSNFVTNSDLGLETTDDYPYERQSRHYNAWNDQRYRERGHIRYYLTRICHASKNIKGTLVHHFLLNPENRRFPVAADIYTGKLIDRAAAAERAANGGIFRHANRRAYGFNSNHTVLVVGISVAGNVDQHYALIKNSWGVGYGDQGFTRVGFEVLNKIWFPAANDKGEWFGTSVHVASGGEDEEEEEEGEERDDDEDERLHLYKQQFLN